jgi:Flp pilus assembly protein TadD
MRSTVGNRLTLLLLALVCAASLAVVRSQDALPPEASERLPYRGSAGEVRPAHQAPLVPLSIPADAKPPVETATVEQIGMDGVGAFQNGNFEGAREAYLRVLKIEPNNIPALVNLGATEYRMGNNTEAERLLRRALQLKPDNPTAWLNLGIIYLERNEPMRALAAVAQAVVHAPDDPVARNYLGVAAGRNRWFDAAESELRRAVELRPDYADAHFNLAVFCLERVPPATELARRHYRRALDLGAEPDPLVEKALQK